MLARVALGKCGLRTVTADVARGARCARAGLGAGRVVTLTCTFGRVFEPARRRFRLEARFGCDFAGIGSQDFLSTHFQNVCRTRRGVSVSFRFLVLSADQKLISFRLHPASG